jgi:hypothetical protein
MQTGRWVGGVTQFKRDMIIDVEEVVRVGWILGID